MLSKGFDLAAWKREWLSQSMSISCPSSDPTATVFRLLIAAHTHTQAAVEGGLATDFSFMLMTKSPPVAAFLDTLAAAANDVHDLPGAEKLIVSAMARLPHSPSGPAPRSLPFPPAVVTALAEAAWAWEDPSASSAEMQSRLALANWASARRQAETVDACKDTKALFAFWRGMKCIKDFSM